MAAEPYDNDRCCLRPQDKAQKNGICETASDGIACISPAKFWYKAKNCELSQLYPLFPYERLGVGKPDLELALNTWRHGSHEVACQKGSVSWQQTGIF